MKLLVISPYFYPKVGGVEKYVYEITSRLVKNYDIELTILCSNWDKNPYIEEKMDMMTIHRMPFIFKVSSTPFSPFWYKKINSIIDKEKPDIINGHVPVPYIGDLGAKIAEKKGIDYILTYHNDLVGKNLLMNVTSKIYYQSMGLKTLERSKVIVTTSDYYAKNSPYLSKFNNKLKVVSPGVDIESYKIERTDFLKDKYGLNGEKIVLFVGQLNKESSHKGLDYLMRAVAMLTKKINLKLIVVGTGNNMEHYIKLGKEMGINSLFTGYVDEKDLPKYYNNADLFVLPSYNQAEGFGMVLIEAQACGIPVIGSNVGGIPFAIKGGGGLLVPPKNEEILAKNILKILNDSELGKKMGLAGHNKVKKNFTWDNSTKKFFNILEEVLKN